MHRTFIRLLTLACFFHFSGLNNGIACVVQAGEMESNLFAPVFFKKCAEFLSYSNLKQNVRGINLRKICRHSGRVVEVSSQNALRGILSETVFVHVKAQKWLEKASVSGNARVQSNHDNRLNLQVFFQAEGRQSSMEPYHVPYSASESLKVSVPGQRVKERKLEWSWGMCSGMEPPMSRVMERQLILAGRDGACGGARSQIYGRASPEVSIKVQMMLSGYMRTRGDGVSFFKSKESLKQNQSGNAWADFFMFKVGIARFSACPIFGGRV